MQERLPPCTYRILGARVTFPSSFVSAMDKICGCTPGLHRIDGHTLEWRHQDFDGRMSESNGQYRLYRFDGTFNEYSQALGYVHCRDRLPPNDATSSNQCTAACTNYKHCSAGSAHIIICTTMKPTIMRNTYY